MFLPELISSAESIFRARMDFCTFPHQHFVLYSGCCLVIALLLQQIVQSLS
jgi:hypothetical protein